MLQGDFTGITAPGCNAGRQITLKAPFVNNQISPALFSPAALNLVKHVPSATDSCGRVQFGTVSNSDEKLGLARGDYLLSSKHTLFARYYVAHLDQDSTYNNNDPLTITMPWVTDNMQFFVLSDTYLIGPNTISSFHATLNRGSIQKG
jgi:hypothetical protein